VGCGLALWAFALSGCGRIGYDVVGSRVSGAGDADSLISGDADAGRESGLDSGRTAVDAGLDVAPDAYTEPPGRVEPLFPRNGFATGSVHVSADARVVDHPLRPKLMWLPTAGATEYEVELEDSCEVGSFRACAFPSPEVSVRTGDTTFRPAVPVSREAPVGRRYHWRVRACRRAACGDWSEVRYLDVGRNGDDFNGDGYADLVVGARLQLNPEVREGNVFVYFGSPTGPRAEPDLTLDNPADRADGFFGEAVASAGDVNGDGYADLVVGASNQERVYLYLGSVGGLRPEPDFTLGVSGFVGAVAGAGDVNGDGYADLVVGAARRSNPEVGEGNAFVYFGSAMGPRPEPDLTLDNPADQAGGGFGAAVATAGDVNGDGYADIVAGAPYQSRPERSEGNAFVYLGSPTGPGAEPDLHLDNPANQEDGRFGEAVASAGDVDGDGYDDLVIGAPWQSNPERREGNAFVYFGSPGGARPVPELTLDNPAEQLFGSFGGSVAGAGDVNGDGHADLVVGAFGQDNPEAGEGNAFVYLGSPAGLRPDPELTLDNPADQMLGAFGSSLASAGDVDGDGYADLLIGAYIQANPEPQEGNAFLYLGSAIGLPAEPDLNLDNPTDQAGAEFGVSVASAGDLDGVGDACVLVATQKHSAGVTRSRRRAGHDPSRPTAPLDAPPPPVRTAHLEMLAAT
jgi:hypothetical protein